MHQPEISLPTGTEGRIDEDRIVCSGARLTVDGSCDLSL